MSSTSHGGDGQTPTLNKNYDPYPQYSLINRVVLTAIVCLALVLVFIISFHLYLRYLRLARSRSQRRPGAHNPHNTHNILFLITSPTESQISIDGLHPSAIAAIPTIIYSKAKVSEAGGDTGVECPVCLSYVEEGEEVRVLPNCKHIFHLECVDMWLGAHSTCPLCRLVVEPPVAPVEAVPMVARLESSNNPIER